MVTSVTLGSFYQSNGKTVLGGSGGSGLDTESLIKSLTEAKALDGQLAQNKITSNGKISSALTTMQTLIDTFSISADALRNPPGVGNAADNAFKYTSAQVTSDGATPGNNYLTVTTTPGATLQSYSITEVSSLASAARQSSGIFTVSGSDQKVVPPASGSVGFAAGTITIRGQDIQIDASDSLDSIAAKFNAVSDTSKVSATVIKIAEGQFQLSFVATETGSDNGFDLTTVTGYSTVLSGLGLSAAVEGTDAEFKINGVDVTRSKNTIDDLISGVTFNLLQKTNGAELTVKVQPDITTTQNTIINFVNAYNAIKTFAAEQTKKNSDGSYAETAVLANNTTFLSVMNSLTSQISSKVSGLASMNSLADLGITFTNKAATDTMPAVDNVLTVNDAQLTSALTSNFAGVSKLFGVSVTSPNPNIKLFSSTNALAVSNFTLNINPPGDGSEFEVSVSYTGGTTTMTPTALRDASGKITGYTLTGKSGTVLEGLVLIYASTTSGSVNVTATQGIAATTYNTSFNAIKPGSGLIDVALTGLKNQETQLNKDVERVNAQVADYREQLLKKFGALEAAISRTNTLLQSLSAQADARNNA